MDIRMLPIRNVFERFPRLVRDIARQQGKEVELILEGEETRVDKAIIDEIGEPLVHMIRNSVDHGLESPAERRAKGKTPAGTILLSAAQESNQVVITIMDDGRGIDAVRGAKEGDRARPPPRRRRAHRPRGHPAHLRRGVLDRGLRDRPLGPGGGARRGAASRIERLNGLIEAETMPGVGTKFTIQLPLTLAIISVLHGRGERADLRPPLGVGRGEPQASSARTS